MTTFVFANNVNTTLATAASSSATSLLLSSSANLPTLSAGQVMPLTLNDAATGTLYEIVYVTAISGSTLTVTRAREGTGALNWNIGDYAFCAFTAGSIVLPPALVGLAAADPAAANKIPYTTGIDTYGNLQFDSAGPMGTSGTTVPSEEAVMATLNGRAWHTPTRAAGTPYTNNNGHEIQVQIVCNSSGSGVNTGATFSCTGMASIVISAYNITYTPSFNVLVPNGATYELTVTSGCTLSTWSELY